MRRLADGEIKLEGMPETGKNRDFEKGGVFQMNVL